MSPTLSIASNSINLEVNPNSVLISHDGMSMPVSLSPKLIFGDREIILKAIPGHQINDLSSGHIVTLNCATERVGGSDLQSCILLQWSPKEKVLRKWVRIQVTGSSIMLKKVILDEYTGAPKPIVSSPVQPSDATGQPDPQSYPVFIDGFFAGVEFPIASTSYMNGKLILAHTPSTKLQAGRSFTSKKAVYGVAQKGTERIAFQQYISANRSKPLTLHVNYNSWWTSPVPYSETDISKLMGMFEKNLTKPYGVSFDTFCIDMGWSQREAVWDIDPKTFPKGFAKIKADAERMKSRLGLWISPSNCYSPGSFDNEWAAKQGYEMLKGVQWDGKTAYFACLAGPKYQARFAQQLCTMATRWGVRHFKFDGYLPTCPESNHGHTPGIESAEAVANGFLSAIKQLRKAAPDAWLETTCMGWNPSPWWLFHVNSVVGTYGDDAPYGRVPCPVYRESYTTGRDYFNLQGAALLPIPIAAQEVLGIVHQTSEPLENDAVTTILRGNMFLPVYLNPGYMNDSRWKAFAGTIAWARKNASILQVTTPILPASWSNGKVPHFSATEQMPREPYGYAHWKNGKGFIMLRNPWIEPITYKLKLDSSVGLAGNVTGLSAVSIYPEPRLYGSNLDAGKTLDVPLAPYETVVLSISARQSVKGVPVVAESLKQCIDAKMITKEIRRIEFDGPAESFGPDWTSLTGDMKSATEVHIVTDIDLKAPQGEMLLLLECNQPPTVPVSQISVNGKKAEFTMTGSEFGWAASGVAKVGHWVFLRVPLTNGKNNVDASMLVDSAFTNVSAWVWASRAKPAGPANYPNTIPSPELISLNSLALLAPITPDDVPNEILHKTRPVEHIDGIYLDTIEPESVVQGWGVLQKNKSVWEKPMTIAGQRFVRGLGTHAKSRIIYDLHGSKYSRFQSWVGADGATSPTITFEVWIDGIKRWESGLMDRSTQAKWVDVDIAGASKLELIVGDGGNSIMGDHANWADARLVK